MIYAWGILYEEREERSVLSYFPPGCDHGGSPERTAEVPECLRGIVAEEMVAVARDRYADRPTVDRLLALNQRE